MAFVRGNVNTELCQLRKIILNSEQRLRTPWFPGRKCVPNTLQPRRKETARKILRTQLDPHPLQSGKSPQQNGILKERCHTVPRLGFLRRPPSEPLQLSTLCHNPRVPLKLHANIGQKRFLHVAEIRARVARSREMGEKCLSQLERSNWEHTFQNALA